MATRIDLTGQRFGRLQVLDKAESTPQGKAKWLCVCDCGVTLSVRSETLRRGDSMSCGCLASEMVSQRNFRHGHWLGGYPTKSWLAWRNMKSRCENPKDKRFNVYGARGVKVCERWQEFENFFADMGMPPSKNHSIDRIDVDGNYEPSNCRWVTQKTQQRNRSNNRIIEFNGKRQCLSQWAEEYGISQKRLRTRIERDGWDIEKALTTPLKGGNSK